MLRTNTQVLQNRMLYNEHATKLHAVKRVQNHAENAKYYLLPVYQATSRVTPDEVSSMYAKLKPAEIPITSVSTKRRPITRPSACTGAYIGSVQPLDNYTGTCMRTYTGAHVQFHRSARATLHERARVKLDGYFDKCTKFHINGDCGDRQQCTRNGSRKPNV